MEKAKFRARFYNLKNDSETHRAETLDPLFLEASKTKMTHGFISISSPVNEEEVQSIAAKYGVKISKVSNRYKTITLLLSPSNEKT